MCARRFYLFRKLSFAQVIEEHIEPTTRLRETQERRKAFGPKDNQVISYAVLEAGDSVADHPSLPLSLHIVRLSHGCPRLPMRRLMLHTSLDAPPVEGRQDPERKHQQEHIAEVFVRFLPDPLRSRAA